MPAAFHIIAENTFGVPERISTFWTLNAKVSPFFSVALIGNKVTELEAVTFFELSIRFTVPISTESIFCWV